VSARGATVAVSRRGRRALGAYFAAFVLLLYLPTAILLIFSFNDNTVPVFPLQGFTTKWYGAAWHDENLRAAFVRSLKVASLTSVIATAIGVLAGYALTRRSFRGRNAITALMLVPLVVPPVVVAVALLMLFRKGPVHVDLSLTTVLVGHVVIALPFTLLLLVPRIAGIDRSLEEAAHDLGASGVTTFRRVILPLIVPAILSSVLIAFVISIDEYAIASFLSANSETYPVYLFGQIRQAEHLPPMIPVATVMLALSGLVVVLAEVLRRRGDRRLGLEQRA
jgi:spermidine/putrescine transport system permease protein